jgi:hypothetical protein
MKGRPRSSPIHRDKITICEDLAIILGPDCVALSDGAKYAVIDQALALWSAHEGKYDGCRYWTKDAIVARHEHLRYDGTGQKPPYEHQLIHEHIVPRNIIRDVLLRSHCPSAEEVNDLLEQYCVGAVITKPQDARLTDLGLRNSMPRGWQFGNIWARYHASGIEIVDRTNGDAPIPMHDGDGECT